MVDEVLTVRQAAEILGVSPRRVHALIDAGELACERIGGRAVLSRVVVDGYRRRRGRKPLRPENAWGLLAVAAGTDMGGDSDRRRRWRFDRQLAALEDAGTDWPVWLSVLRRRGNVGLFRAHPSVLESLAADERLVRTGVSAAREYGLDVVAGGEVEGYVHACDVDGVIDDFVLEPATDIPNVTLRVVPEDVDPSGGSGETALLPAVLLDLLDSDDERTRRAGADGFKSLLADLGRRRREKIGEA